MKPFLAAALAASLILPPPAYAGGPVLVEDATEDAAPQEKRPCVIGCLALGAIVIIGIAALAGGGSDCTCHDQPTDGGGSCGC